MKKAILNRITILLMAIMLLPCAAFAEVVRGTVTDQSGEPLVGVAIMVKGSNGFAAITDIDGKYAIQVADPKMAVLVATYVGMQPSEVEVKGRANVDIVMRENADVLEEVVVVGYGQQKKVSVVGAITQTSGEVLQRTGGVSSVGAALTGNLPGVITTQSTGKPGEEDPQIVIRGVSSWNNSQPLILVDGIERPMTSVDISSVKSLSVLKDASATAVYGVKGANGVILITTKRGEEGRAQISVGMNVTMKRLSEMPGIMNSGDALMIRNQAIERELGLSPDSWSRIVTMDMINKYRNPANQEERERYPDVDWQSELFNKSAMSYNPNINISGGTSVVKYFASVDFLHEGDMYKQWDNNRGYKTGYGYNRVNVRSNLDFKITKTTTLKTNLFGSHGQRTGLYGTEDNTWYESQLWQSAYGTPPDAFMPRYSDGTWGYYGLDGGDSQSATNSVMSIAIGGLCKYTTTRINTDFTLEQDLGFITPGLRAMAMVSWDNLFLEKGRGINDLYHGAQSKWINPETGEVSYSEKSISKSGFDFIEGIKWTPDAGSVNDYSTQRHLYYQAQINWGRQFGEHDVTAMAVFNRSEQTYGKSFTNYREDWAFRVTYNYADRYFLEYNGAYNGSEKFSSKNRFHFFNSGAAGWMISNEKFMSFARPWLDILKVRYSIGQVGEDYVPQRWLYATQWAYGDSTFQGLYADVYSPYTWYYLSQLGNENIHWETATKQNLGIDYSFWNHFAAGSLEFFRDDRKDILIQGSSRAVPSYYGGTAPTANLGKARTTGFELELRLSYTVAKDWHLWGNFNMTHAKNKILAYDDPELTPDYQKTTGYAIGQDHVTYTAGYANTWAQVYGIPEYNTNETSKLPGQYITVDYNGDGIIDTNDSAPYGYTGTPQNTYSASVGLEWKGFSVYLQFYGVTNVNRYVSFTSLYNKLDTVYKADGSYWTPWNQDADCPMPRYLTNTSYYDGMRAHYDGSYIRLKNAEIAYTWTKGWVKKLGLANFKLYLNGNNLWMWHKMPDDRESNTNGSGWSNNTAYPTVKRFNLGFKFDI